ncbi:hypothetical protein [Nocardia sp. alder85J]|uniref:hypothetical protein n=1 Tax=Nocardia sp. alder85J TaxID=2862949 RepID=UPI001CD46703|nr:hypothetical protein [Nocardia sp. alder85J]MCX4094962.1 hypothetical protein [Nocardia sp. alder85J]
MTAPVELGLPCQVVTLTVRFGRRGQLTTLEDLVARIWLTGRNSLADIAGFLGLPVPIVKDVAIDMWHKGFMTFDLDNGSVHLTDVTREILSRDEAPDESGMDTATMDFLFEPITGRVLRHARTAGERSIRLPSQAEVTESDLDQTELVRAVQNALREDERRTGPRTVLEVSFGHPMLRAAKSMKWASMLVTVQRYPRSDQVTVAPVDFSWKTRDTQRLNAYLGRLVDESPDHPVLRSLRGRSESVLRPPDRTEDLIERLGERVAELRSTPPEQVELRSEELRRLATRIHERLDVDRTGHATVTLVGRDEGHAWAVTDLIASARTQLLIVSPESAFQQVRDVLPALIEAIDRGVQLVVVWGRALDDELPGPVGTAFAKLRDRYPQRVLIARRSARTEACLVVQDDSRALVGSHAVLSGRTLGRTAVSVLVEPVDENPPRAVVDLLLWARRQYPHWQEGQRIKLHRDQFGRATVAGRGPAPREVALPVTVESMDEPAVRLWAQGWVEHHAALVAARARAGARGPVVDVVTDGEHRTLLDHCVHGARRRLIITDDRIDPAVADTDAARTIKERRGSGAAVLVVHPPLPRVGGDGGNEFVTLDTGPDKVAVRREAGGARLVVSDDQLLIGSFSLLAGGHGRGARQRSHIGLHIRSEVVATELASLLRAEPAPPARSADGVTEYPPSAEYRSAVPAALPLLFAARAASPGRPFAEQVVQGLRDIADPWAVLDDWRRQQVSAAELRTAVAALLRADRHLGSESGRKWAEWLIHDAWQRRAFMAAAVIGGMLPAAADLRTVSVLAVALETGPVHVVVDGALELSDGSDPSAAAAGAVAAAAEMLLWTDEEGKEALELLSESLPPTWQELADAAIRFAGTGVALPIAALVGDHRMERDRLASRVRREKLVADIDKLRRLRARFDFDTGQALYAALFAADGLLTVIDQACRAGTDRNSGLDERLPIDVRTYLDDQIAEARMPPMQWYRQRRYLRSIEDIVRSARVVAGERIDGSRLLVDRSVHAACTALGGSLAEAWDRLYIEAKSVQQPYDQPLLAMLERLTPLLMWAREQS